MTKLVTKTIIDKDYERAIAEAIRSISEDETLSISLIATSSPDYSDYSLVELATKYSCVHSVTLLGGEVIKTSGLSGIDKAVLLIKHAKARKTKALADEILGKIIEDKWQVNFFAEDLEELASQVPESSIQAVKHATSRRENKIRGYHSTSYEAQVVDDYSSIFKEVVESSDKLTIFNGHMGVGKTKFLQMCYSYFRDADMHPVMASGRRTITSNFDIWGQGDHYQSNATQRKGVIGVVNTLVKERHDETRKLCKVLIIDEAEVFIDQLATGSLGRTYKDRIDAMDSIEEFAGVDKVLVADATITDQTIGKLVDMFGAQAKIYTAEGEQNRNTIKLRSESELVQEMILDANAGSKVAGFCDYNAEEFSSIVETLKEATGKRVIGVSAAYFEETGRTLDDMSEIIEEADVLLASPVINAGASIIDERFKRVYVMSGYTLGPISILQSLRRFRCATEAHLSFKRGNPDTRSRSIEPATIIHSALIKTSDYPFAETHELIKTKSGEFLARHAASKNVQFRNFKQNVIISAQQLGYEVIRTEADLKKIKKGREAKKVGRASNEEISRAAAHRASDLLKSGQPGDIDFGTQGAQTFAQQETERTVSALDLLQLDEISDESYEHIFKLDIDRIALARKIISKDISDSQKITRMDIAADVAVKFFADAGVNLDNRKGSVVTTQSAEYACENLLEAVALETGNASTGISLIKLVFPNAQLNKVNKIQVVKDCLKALGVDLAKTSTSNKTREYGIVDFIRKTKKDKEVFEHNITQIADKYCRIDVKEASNVQLLHSANVLITDEEKRARRAIDRKIAIEAERIAKDERRDDTSVE